VSVSIEAAAAARAKHDPGGKSKPAWPIGSKVDASFSHCGRYRWLLSEIWDDTLPVVGWILMNPSVAGIKFADPTLIKTGKFTRRWGYGGQLIANASAYRITDSRRLCEVADPIGPENDAAILAMARRSGTVVLAFGQPPRALRNRGLDVIQMLRAAGVTLKCLRLAQDGRSPWHPLYLRDDTELMDYPA
jgi:hypothetical protein